ncbi:MAG TPA: GrpB family protein [Gaiellaceae bacterium]|jgi:GrpB-like predicted nucleotidyltransferase (UPF0157 family)
MSAPIAVVPYDPAWPELFEAERATLEPLLRPWLEGGVHHIGSTAVPGLAAKPLIDMMAGVRALEDARAAHRPLLAAGWEHTPHRPGIAHHFSRPGFGLHLTEPGSDLWVERLTFRDALRADPALAAEYTVLKQCLAEEYADDVVEYTARKRDFVIRVLAPAGVTLGRR